MTNARWTLDELGAEVKAALHTSNYRPAASARVRAVPDRRTIRYYTTLGLLDRPAEMRGRTAFYGPRHLLQLVAIKRLQADGLTLSEVQQRLAGLPNQALEDLAAVALPGSRTAASVAGTPSVPSTPGPQREDFWSALPADLPPEPTERAVGVRSLQGLDLDEHVTLLVTSARALDPEVALALQRAASPLLDLLRTHGLIPPAAPAPGSDDGTGERSAL
jgi:DNA-binding transcriptional MerR regulator